MSSKLLNVSEPVKPVEKKLPKVPVEKESEREGQVWLDFLRGSDVALGDIYRTYSHRLYNYGRQITRDESLVLDAVQDVFLELIKSREKLGVAVSVKFYLYASFRRCLLRQIKRKGKVLLHEDINDEGFQIAVDSHHLIAEHVFPSDQKKIIEEMCNKLPPTQREALVLYYFEQMSYKEVAEVMHLSQIKAARNRIYRALDTLARLLLPYKKEF